jgi:prephenate dehydrogenase
VLANVLVEQAAASDPGADEALPRVGPSLRDMTRVAGANSDIWTDIYTSNAEAITTAIDDTRARLAAVAELLRSGDANAIRRWNDAARQARDRQLAAAQPDGPVTELRVSVPNRPGIVGELAVALGKAGVNIVDMALAPAPDNRSGAISFWISGDRSTERARELLEELGLPVGGER